MRSFILLILLSVICASSSLEITCGMQQLDTKFSPLTRAMRDVIWPTNYQEFKQKCSTSKKALVQAQKFKDECSEGESKTLLTVALKALEKSEIKEFCKIKVAQQKTIESSSCFNSGKDTASKCWPRLISSVTLAANWSDSNARIPILCCSYIKWKDCFVKAYEEIGGPVCTEANIEYIDKYLHKAMMDPMRIFCSEYLFTDKCDKYENILESMETIKVEYLTPIPASLELFKGLYSAPTLTSDQEQINSTSRLVSNLILILLGSWLNLLFFTVNH